MAENKLVLHPVNPWAILQDAPALMDSLRRIGLVGPAFSYVGELHYRAGSRFVDLLSFRDGAPTDATSRHLSLLETTETPSFLGASNAHPPACPACGAKMADWTNQLLEWQNARERYAWSCAGCGRKMRVEELSWGATGGIARYSLDIWNIAEGDALPSAALLSHLEEQTFERWRYFYYRF
jgi:hypothetical protein